MVRCLVSKLDFPLLELMCREGWEGGGQVDLGGFLTHGRTSPELS